MTKRGLPRPFLTAEEWPGRRVRATAPPLPETTATRQGEGLDIVPRSDHEPVRRYLGEALAAVEELEEQARRTLEEHLHAPIAGLAQTQEAVLVLSGRHPQFGDGYPAVPQEHQLEEKLEIDAQLFERAYRTMERADRILYGFDATDVLSEPDGKVQPYAPITSPAEASGEVPPLRLDERIEIEEALERRLTTTKRDIWTRAAYAVGYVLVRLLGDLVDSIARSVSSALTIKFLGRRLRLGKPLAWPFRKLARLLYRLADWLEAKALGLSPGPEPPERARLTAGALDGLLPEAAPGELELDPAESRLGDSPEDYQVSLGTGETDYGSSSSGIIFLMAAQQVLTRVEGYARRPGAAELARALRLYEASRAARRHYEALEGMARSWGIAPPAAAPPASGPPPEAPPPVVPEDDVTFPC